MFGKNNLGTGTKALAKLLFLIGTLCSLVGGIFLIYKKLSIGYLVIFGGIVLSYIICYLIHVLGHIASKVEKIENDLQKGKNEEKRLSEEKAQAQALGFSGLDKSETNEIDELILLRKEGKITEDEFNAQLAIIVRK